MTARAATLLEEVLALPESQRVEFAEKVLHSLEPTDPHIDSLWAREARDRANAFLAGELPQISEVEFFADSDDA